MTPIETTVILLILIDIAATFYLARASANVISARIQDLDQSLAEALANTLEELPGSIGEAQQMNPFHMLIAQVIQEQLKKPSINVTEIAPRAKDGKFSS